MELTIPEPCQEKWHRMTHDNKGRFCMACNKQVINFSRMTDQQIIDYLDSSSGSVCGRFAGAQLNRKLHNTTEQPANKWRLSLCFPLFMGVARSTAQGKPMVKYKAQVKNTSIKSMTKHVCTISPVYKEVTGHVINERGLPVALATVRSLSGSIVAITDTAGMFCLQIPIREKEMIIIATYENKEAQFVWQEAVVTGLLLQPVNKIASDEYNYNPQEISQMLSGSIGKISIQNTLFATS